MRELYDVIIIGGGNAGFSVSSVAHEAGKSIAFVEARDFGGTCPNRGCTPKKFLWQLPMQCTRSNERPSTGSKSASQSSIGRN